MYELFKLSKGYLKVAKAIYKLKKGNLSYQKVI